MTRRNGKAEPARRRPVRTFVVKLDGEYEGTEAVMISNPPLRMLDELSEDEGLQDFDRVRRATAALTQSWNFVDADGNGVPLDDRWAGLTAEEVWALLAAWYDARRSANGLPKESADASASTSPSST